jgi:hypothetical protein
MFQAFVARILQDKIKNGLKTCDWVSSSIILGMLSQNFIDLYNEILDQSSMNVYFNLCIIQYSMLESLITVMEVI